MLGEAWMHVVEWLDPVSISLLRIHCPDAYRHIPFSVLQATVDLVMRNPYTVLGDMRQIFQKHMEYFFANDLTWIFQYVPIDQVYLPLVFQHNSKRILARMMVLCKWKHQTVLYTLCNFPMSRLLWTTILSYAAVLPKFNGMIRSTLHFKFVYPIVYYGVEFLEQFQSVYNYNKEAELHIVAGYQSAEIIRAYSEKYTTEVLLLMCARNHRNLYRLGLLPEHMQMEMAVRYYELPDLEAYLAAGRVKELMDCTAKCLNAMYTGAQQTLLWLHSQHINTDEIINRLTNRKITKVVRDSCRKKICPAYSGYRTTAVIVRDGKFVEESIPELIR